MILVTSQKREAQKFARAIATLTGYWPTVFRMPGGYRVQENEYGARWGEALKAALADGIKPSKCHRDVVARYLPRW